MPQARRSIMTKNEQALSPPRRVIRALYNHTAHQPEELSFSQGDFFHVVGNEEDKDWYEATNPVTGQRGYVPVTFFQVVDKNSTSKHSHSHSHSSHHSHSSRHQQKQRSSNQSLEDSGIDSGSYTDSASPQYSNRSPIGSHSSVHTATLPKCPPLYGVVLYDFAAERQDELESKSGDAILVIAQSNAEWYVAKPIGRLGGPGLIPVSYIEIRDMVTGKAIDVAKYLRETGTAIPRVEEWKKQTMEYKANSIPLGRIDANEAPQHQYPPQQQHPSHQSHPPHQQHQQQQQHHHHHHHQQQQQQQHATARRQHQSMPQPQPQHHLSKTASHQHLDHHGGHHGPTLQDLKNKVSRDMRSQRNPSQDLRVDHPGKLSRPHTTDPYDDHPLSRTQMDHSRVINASVESFHHEEGRYWFSVRVDLSSGATRNLFRLYEDFYDFHIALLEEFPVESGRVGDQPRILPFMPIPLQNVDDKVSASRRSDLDGYVQELCRLPAKITQHPLVLELLSVKDGDMETLPSPGPSAPAPSKAEFYGEPTDRRPSTAMGTSRPHGNGTTAGGGGVSHKYKDETRSIDGSSPSTRSQATFSNPNTMSIPPLGNNNVNGSGANEMARGASGERGGGGGGESNGIHQASVAGNGAGSKAEDMIKVKISYEDDIMAIRIPVTITFRALQQKIFERLLCSHKELSYRDDRGDFASIQDDNDVRDAIDRSGGKLMIYVD